MSHICVDKDDRLIVADDCQRGVKFMFYGHQTGLFGVLWTCCTGTVALCVGYTPGCRNCEEWLI